MPMKLITAELRENLLRNGARRGADHLPVLKLFSPCGPATWLFTELDPDTGDHLFGLCDLGFGFPELGYASLAEISAVRLPSGLAIERDLWFRARHPLSVYTAAARAAGRIVEHGPELDRAGAPLSPDDETAIAEFNADGSLLATEAFHTGA